MSDERVSELQALLPCPCGKVPDRLIITAESRTPKYALCSGDCCDDWQVEFRADYAEPDTNACQGKAAAAWNAAARAQHPAPPSDDGLRRALLALLAEWAAMDEHYSDPDLYARDVRKLLAPSVGPSAEVSP